MPAVVTNQSNQIYADQREKYDDTGHVYEQDPVIHAAENLGVLSSFLEQPQRADPEHASQHGKHHECQTFYGDNCHANHSLVIRQSTNQLKNNRSAPGIDLLSSTARTRIS